MNTTKEPTVLDELARINREIEGCEHALTVAKRLNARGKPVPLAQVIEVTEKLEKARREFQWFSGAIQRYSERPAA